MLQMDYPPQNINGRVLVPVRPIFEALGAQVGWDATSKTATGAKGNTKVSIQIDNNKAYINEKVSILDVPAQIIGGRSYVPARFVAEALGCAVGYDGTSKTVIITSSDSRESVSDLKISFIDVGQGDSILIQSPSGKTMLIDAGTNESTSTVVNYIKDQGIKNIDVIVETHPHEDHIGGMDAVINTFDIGQIFMPKVSAATKTFQDVLTAIQNKRLKVTTAVSGIPIDLDPAVKIEMLAPNSSSYEDVNNYSAVIKLTYNDTSFLFTGDAQEESEKEMLAKGYDLNADVLKVGHHGSDTSTSPEFLKVASPKYAVISVGKDNDYGHPRQETLDKLSLAGIQIFRTDESGTIVATSDGNTIKFDKKASDIKPHGPPVDTSDITIDDSSIISVPMAPSIDDPVVYITSSGTKYHVDGCRYLGENKIPISLSEAKTKGYTPCKVCNPPQ
jgi:competence protein ComEC